MTLALPVLPRIRSPFALAAERLDRNSARAAADRERDAAMADVRAFARHARIRDRDGIEIAFGEAGWPWQFRLLSLWTATPLSVVLKARQLGVSWLAAIYALWWAMRRPGQQILLISKGQLDAEELLAKVAYVLERLPPAWRPEAVVNTRMIRLLGLGSEIEAMPATERVGRSRTANLVILDEHAHQPWARKILLAVKAAAEAGQIISMSSANGQGALHSQLYLGAKTGTNGWQAIFVPASAHPGRTGNWRERARAELAELSDADFAQEYPENDVEAIAATGRPVFRPEDLARQKLLVGQNGEFGLSIFAEPEAGKMYLIGADVGEGLATSDWSSAAVLERDSGEQVAHLRGRWTPDIFAARIDRLARRYAARAGAANRLPVIVAVERNNHGHAVLLRLTQLHAGTGPYQLFRARDKRLGWLTTTATRPVLIDQLEEALRTDALALHDAGSVDQFATFHWNDDGRPEAQEGYHDDDVLAVGIALQLRRRAYGRVLGIREPEAKAA